MLTGESSAAAHILQNAALIALSILLLPLDTSVLLLTWLLVPRGRLPKAARQGNTSNAEKPTVLVTGVGMTKGLALARLFYLAGHRVIGADFEPDGALVCGRVSKSVARFYRLTKPTAKQGSSRYILDLLRVIQTEKVDLWVSCSGVASAIEDGRAKEAVEMHTNCKAVQFDVCNTETLHAKDSFIRYTQSLGLTVPETHVVTDRDTALRVLNTCAGGGGGSVGSQDKKFIMKCTGVDDSSRGDLTLLPRPSAAETRKHLNRLNISPENPWILQQFIRGEEYCTHSLVVRGQVKAFVACPSSELLMHYEALPASSPLAKSMLSFTQRFAAEGREAFTGHLSFDFLVEGSTPHDTDEVFLYPIECNPRAHTAVALFNGTPELAGAYMSLLSPRTVKVQQSEPVVPRLKARYYWIGHDVVTLAVLPALHVLKGSASLGDCLDGLRELATHVLTWKDGTYEMWDPLPWWWLYHVYWPLQFWNSIVRGKKWSRINVSTTKMFEC